MFFRRRSNSDTATGDNRLARIIRETIARRQATLRPGEAPYRPILRFEVYPDGVRAYFTAFQLLESLQLPMVRHNVEPAEPDLSTYFRK